MSKCLSFKICQAVQRSMCANTDQALLRTEMFDVASVKMQANAGALK